jgi:hypothetical protein
MHRWNGLLSRLWALGREHFASAPAFFPETPVMFVAHTYASVNAFRLLRATGVEGGFRWRDIVIPLHRGSGPDPSR